MEHAGDHKFAGIAKALDSNSGRLLIQGIGLGVAVGIILTRISGLETKITGVEATQTTQNTAIVDLKEAVSSRKNEVDRLTDKMNDLVIATMNRSSEILQDHERRLRDLELENARNDGRRK